MTRDDKIKEIYRKVNETKHTIKRLRASAKESNHLADELAKSNSLLIRQLKAYEQAK